MNTNIIPISHSSPFDQIRQVRKDGSEFWSARDLMPLMGYASWRNFETPLNRAVSTARNQGVRVEINFAGSRKVIPGQRGPAQQDYELSRFAAYLVAMNGDPNMSEVAAAQAYFAIRTREAETVQPARELTFEEKALEVMGELKKRVEAQQLENEHQAKQIEAARPYVARATTYESAAVDQNRQEFAREVCKWAREQAAVAITQAQVFDFLSRRLHMFIRGDRQDSGHATAEAEKRGLAVTAKGTKDGFNWATGRLTPKGQTYAWKRIVEHINQHGSLLESA